MTAEQFHSKTNMRIILPLDETAEKVKANVYRFAESYAVDQLAEKEREHKVELALLQAQLNTLHLVSEHGDRVKEFQQLKETATQSKQYVEHAQEREHRFAEIERRAEAAEQRLQEAQRDLDADDLDMHTIASEAGTSDATREGIVKRVRELRQREAELEQLREQKLID